jgi:uncharacterized protein YbaP (TraB family)
MRTAWKTAAALAAGLAAAPAAAEPAMWTVRDADTTVTLFGTIHVLPPDAAWPPPALAAAMAEADSLWLEIDILSDTSATMAMITEGTSPGRPLKARLQPRDYEALVAVAASAGVPMSQIERLRPWLAALTLTMGAIRKAGYDEAGADVLLAMQAQAFGTPVRGLETGAEQMGFFAALPEEEETALLIETIRTIGPETDLFETLFDAWEDGDTARLEELLVRSIWIADPDLADRLLARRNRAWAERFEEIMAEPGSRVVAVGAGHLVGTDSLPALLAAKGWTVEAVAAIDGPAEAEAGQ